MVNGRDNTYKTFKLHVLAAVFGSHENTNHPEGIAIYQCVISYGRNFEVDGCPPKENL